MNVQVSGGWPGLVLYLCIVVPWVLGIAVAKSFWIVVGCIFIPPMAWVILAQHFLMRTT